MGKLGKFQTLAFSGWATNVTKVNHISSIFHSAPQKASNTMVQLLAANYGKTLDSLISKFPVREFDSDDEYYWDVIGSARRLIPLIEARDENGTPISSGNVGENNAPFYLVFGESYFFDGEIIFGRFNQAYPLRILGDPRNEGTNSVVKVELMNGSTDGMPAEYLQLGERFSVAYAPVERELSRRVGGVRHATPANMRNEWTTIRLYHKVSGALLDRKMVMGVPMVKVEPSGKMITSTNDMWMHYEEYAFERQWAEYKNNALAYSVSNRNMNGEYLNQGKSGEVIRQGDGLYAQMERGNTYYYNHFSLKLLEEALTAFFAGRVDMNNREVLMRTGEFGALEFSRAARNAASGWKEFEFSGSDLGVMAKKGEGKYSITNPQVVEYLSPNNIRFKVEIDNHYDDPYQHKITHPEGGVANSRRFDIFDLGTMDQPNIFKTAVKGKPEYRGYQWGLMA